MVEGAGRGENKSNWIVKKEKIRPPKSWNSYFYRNDDLTKLKLGPDNVTCTKATTEFRVRKFGPECVILALWQSCGAQVIYVLKLPPNAIVRR